MKPIFSQTISALLLGLLLLPAYASEETIKDPTQAPVLAQATTTQETTQETTQGPATWSYQGKTGPANWGKLSADYSLCEIGKNQSPINIYKTSDIKLSMVKFDYSILVPENIVNTGNALEINILSGGKIKLDKRYFELKKIVFHSASEHLIDTISYPLEAQFIHESKNKELAVVSLLYHMGPPNGALDVLIKNLPYNAGESKRLGGKDVEQFETTKGVKDYFRYNGSLTSPPCTEGVRWVILKKRPTISKNQLRTIQKALKKPNNRPLQPVNARVILR